MAVQRYISSSFWSDDWVDSLSVEEKLLYMYLLTNECTNIAGVYKITIKRMKDDTGISRDSITSILEKFGNSKKAFYKDEHIIIPKWPVHQKLERRPKLLLGAIAVLKSLPKGIIDFLKEDISHYHFEWNYQYHIEDDKQKCDIISNNGNIIPENNENSAHDSDSDSDSDIEFDKENTQEDVQEKKQVIKHKHGSLKNVLLTDDELSRLNTDFGEIKTKQAVEYLSTYKAEKDYKTKSDNLTLRRWVFDAISKRKTDSPHYEPLQSEKKDLPRCGVCGSTDLAPNWCRKCGYDLFQPVDEWIRDHPMEQQNGLF